MTETSKRVRKIKTPEERLAEITEKKSKLIIQEEKLKKEIKEQTERDEKEKMSIFYTRFKKTFPAIATLNKSEIEFLADMMIDDQGERIIAKVLEK